MALALQCPLISLVPDASLRLIFQHLWVDDLSLKTEKLGQVPYAFKKIQNQEEAVGGSEVYQHL